MAKWLLRGLVFAALMVVVRLFQGALINQFETKALLISLVLLLVFAVVVFVWGLIDGRGDARRHPDPDRRGDLAMTWLLAGLVAGLLSGAVSWFISMVYPALYAGGLVNEVTTFAAFTALLVFLPAILAVAIGRWLVDRKAPAYERRREDDDRADTAVFAAVRDDRGETAPDGTQETEQQSSVATIERHESAADPDTEIIPPEERKNS
ncbi:B-4DMT family transporter [soil metagenome]